MSKVSSLNAVYMLREVDMPSFLSGDVDHSDPLFKNVTYQQQQHHYHHQQSQQHVLQQQQQQQQQQQHQQQLQQTSHGVPPDGLDGSIYSQPNGKRTSDSGLPNGIGSGSTAGTTINTWDRTPSGKGSQLSMRSSKRSMGTENEKRSGDMASITRYPTAQEDTDGYFAPVPSNPQSTTGKSLPSKPVTSPSTESLSATPGPRTSISGGPGAPANLAPVVENGTGNSTQAGDDNALRIPQSQVHRASSPATFINNNNNNNNNPSAAPANASTAPAAPSNRLVQRHTLEVPKAAGRTSRDNQADDVGFTTGRFSPSGPGAAGPSRRRASSQLVRRATRSINSELHLDEVAQDEDAARWTEHIKQKRASKRKREEDDDRVVVGTKVDQNHVNWVTAYNMLTGIRFCVSRTNAKIDRELTDADFEAKHKFSFDITGNELTPSAKYDFKFKDYAPWVFRHLRTNFELDPADYLMSLTSKYILSELGSPGKSGSFFYFSRDYKYIIKTIHHAEHKFLRKILREYYNHVKDNPNTLLSQFYGLHRVKIPYGRKIHFVVMNNLFPPHRDIHRTFDLKGSTVGRDFKEDDLEHNPRATLKDLNWLRRNLHLEFGPEKKKAFVEQMQRDVVLLQRLKIMDYSMLVGIHDLERGNEENLRDKTLQVFQPGGDKADEQGPHANLLMRTPSKLETARKAKELRQLIKNEKPVPVNQTLDKMPDTILGENKKNFYFYSDDGGFRATHEDNCPGEEIYYLGIIDCLTHYSFIKRMEHFLKGLSAPESQISAVPPDRYGDRFIRFISGITKTRERAEAEKEISAHPSDPSIPAEDTLNDPQLTGVNVLKPNLGKGQPGSGMLDANNNPAGTDKVMRRAEKQAERSVRHGASEDDVPERSISAMRSPDATERDGMVTLPVIGEAAESSSAHTHSLTGTNVDVTPRVSRESSRGRSKQPTHTFGPQCSKRLTSADRVGELPPPTPPKTDGSAEDNERPPPTPPKDGRSDHHYHHHRPLTPPSESMRRSLEKDLPPVPAGHVRAKHNAVPGRTDAQDMRHLGERFEGLST